MIVKKLIVVSMLMVTSFGAMADDCFYLTRTYDGEKYAISVRHILYVKPHKQNKRAMIIGFGHVNLNLVFGDELTLQQEFLKVMNIMKQCVAK